MRGEEVEEQEEEEEEEEEIEGERKDRGDVAEKILIEGNQGRSIR